MNISKSIKMACIEDDIRQLELAKRTGLSPATLSLITNKHRQPSVESLKVLADAFKMKVSEFIALGE